MDNEFSDTPINSDVNYLVDVVPFTGKTLIYGIYTKLNEFERHFEIISTRYKHIALSWLLASFAGIGFLFSRDSNALPFSHFIGAAIVSLVGLIGVSLIGNIDMNVYHRFWAALFVEEVVMEERYSFLLQSRKITVLIDESKERVFSQNLLYITSNLIFIITIELSLIFEFLYLPFVWIVFIILISVCVLVGSWLLMYDNGLKIQRILHKLIENRLNAEMAVSK